LVIAAAEDIGLANPTALVMANETFAAVERIGMPEGRIPLSQCVIYLATSPKSNAAYAAINQAMKFVQQKGDLPVPLHLRNAPNQFMKDQGFGKDYQYDHDSNQGASGQEFLPDSIADTSFYTPGNNAKEANIRKAMQAIWKEKYGF
jgi:putative ATPase